MSEYAAPAPVGVRLHALDNLRAILMWLGIVLHVAAVYTTHPMPNVWLDEQRTAFADALVSFIHVFRMPAFFILAGFSRRCWPNRAARAACCATGSRAWPCRSRSSGPSCGCSPAWRRCCS